MNPGDTQRHVFKFGASSTPLLERLPTPILSYRHAPVRDEVNEKGNHVLYGLRIFRTGTFTDMFGVEHTWDDTHLDLMTLHYSLLRDADIFPDVPVRQDHSASVANLVGYYQAVYRDLSDPQFLSADIEFTEPDAYEKWRRGTWRARSIEVGMYETNQGAAYFPVVMGLAFVDIPAVEGLHTRPAGAQSFYSRQAVIDNEESNMHKSDAEWAKDPEGWAKAAEYAKALDDWSVAANYAQALVDWERAANYAQALADEEARQKDPANHSKPPVPPVPPTPPAPPVQMSFRINGQQTSDFAAIQAHIDTLEGAISEARTSGRQSFVKQLASDNKIAASQIDDLTNHALSLDDTQFASFRAMYEKAPKLAGLGPQVDAPGGEPPAPGTTPANPDDPEVLKGIVAHHRAAGKTEAEIAQLTSYKKLVALGIEKPLQTN